MPKIWVMYSEFLAKQNLITKTRQTYDRALESLPVTQHHKIWEPYSAWAITLTEVPKTAKSIIKRYLRYNPDFAENYVDFLVKVQEYDEAALYLTKIIDDQQYVSNAGKSKYQFLMDLCNIISKNPTSIVKFLPIPFISSEKHQL